MEQQNKQWEAAYNALKAAHEERSRTLDRTSADRDMHMENEIRALQALRSAMSVITEALSTVSRGVLPAAPVMPEEDGEGRPSLTDIIANAQVDAAENGGGWMRKSPKRRS